MGDHEALKQKAKPKIVYGVITQRSSPFNGNQSLEATIDCVYLSFYMLRGHVK